MPPTYPTPIQPSTPGVVFCPETVGPGLRSWCGYCGEYATGGWCDIYGFKCLSCRERDWEKIIKLFGLVTAEEIQEMNPGMGLH